MYTRRHTLYIRMAAQRGLLTIVDTIWIHTHFGVSAQRGLVDTVWTVTEYMPTVQS